MKINPLKEGILTENFAGIGTVTRQMVRERTVELAAIQGRSAHEVWASDWEQAVQELTRTPETDAKAAILEKLIEAGSKAAEHDQRQQASLRPDN